MLKEIRSTFRKERREEIRWRKEELIPVFVENMLETLLISYQLAKIRILFLSRVIDSLIPASRLGVRGGCFGFGEVRNWKTAWTQDIY